MTSLTLFTPAGVVPAAAPLRLAAKRLRLLGFDVQLDASALARHQRFGGDDATRLDAIHRIAKAAPSIAMATRGGYGMTRLLDQIDWKLLARSVANGTRWCGYSDLTALQMGLLAHTGASSWAAPMALDDFSQADQADGSGGVDDITQDCFVEAMSGALEAVGFRTDAGFDGLAVKGLLWGGNLAMLMSLLGTKHWPVVKGGILFVEEVNEHPYRVERALLQLAQAGVLAQQKAVVLGAISGWKPSPLDRGYTVKTMLARVRAATKTPVLNGLPFGHVQPKVSMPVGMVVQLLVEGRDVLMGWEHGGRGEHGGHSQVGAVHRSHPRPRLSTAATANSDEPALRH